MMTFVKNCFTVIGVTFLCWLLAPLFIPRGKGYGTGGSRRIQSEFKGMSICPGDWIQTGRKGM